MNLGGTALQAHPRHIIMDMSMKLDNLMSHIKEGLLNITVQA